VDPSGHLNKKFTRSQAKDEYKTLMTIYVAYELWSAINFYKTAAKKAVIEIIEEIFKQQVTAIIQNYTLGVIFNKYIDGFYKGGYKKHKVTKYKTVTRHKKKYKIKTTTYENITQTKVTGTFIFPKFKFISKNKTTTMFY